MNQFPHTTELFDELATALGVDELVPDNNGGIQFSVGNDVSVVLFAQDDQTLMVVVPIVSLSPSTDFGTMLWLLKRNFYDSDLDLFRLAADGGGNLVLWGRIPIGSLNGERLLGLLDAVGSEAQSIRGELGAES